MADDETGYVAKSRGKRQYSQRKCRKCGFAWRSYTRYGHTFGDSYCPHCGTRTR